MSIMSKILITSFLPFGLTGSFIRGANASQDISDLMKKHLQSDNFDFLVLPVSHFAPVLLKAYLDATRPAGVIALGENLGMLPKTVRIEPYSHNREASLNPFGPLLSDDKIISPFVKAAFPEQKKSSIGTYYCNAVYKTALQWAKTNNSTPTAFVHVPVLGNRHDQASQIYDVVKAMRHHISQASTSQLDATP